MGLAITTLFGSSEMSVNKPHGLRSEEHTSELQSQFHLVCRLLLEKKKQIFELAAATVSKVTKHELTPLYDPPNVRHTILHCPVSTEGNATSAPDPLPYHPISAPSA